MKSATRITSLATLFFAALSFVNAHGSVDRVIVDGQTFTGPIPGSGPDSNSPVREISTLEPITDPKSAAMACGPGAAASAKLTAGVKAGGNIEYGWRSGEAPIDWPHEWGPVMLYAYQCPDGASAKDCAPPTDAEWILIDAQGFDPNAASLPGSTGWVQDRLHHNQTVKSTIPAGLPNGDYLFRHEIIALHKGGDIGGAEYYVSCTQVQVTGGQDGRATKIGAELAALPGVYSVTDPGIHVNVFDGNLNASNYKMPGPALFVGSGPGGAQNNAPSPSPSSTGGGKDAPTPSPTDTGSAVPSSTPSKSSTCKRKNKNKRSLKHKRELRSRHFARAAAAAEGIALRGTPQRIVDLQY